MRTPDSEMTEKTEETWKYSFHLGLFISETKYLQKYSKCNSLTIRITLLFSTKELYSQLSLGPVFLFWSVAYSQLFLKLFKFILNHSSIGIPSMHNRNFPFFCGFLFTVAVEYAVPDFSRCSRECSFPWTLRVGSRQAVLSVLPWIPFPGIARLSAASLLYLPALTCFHCLL